MSTRVCDRIVGAPQEVVAYFSSNFPPAGFIIIIFLFLVIPSIITRSSLFPFSSSPPLFSFSQFQEPPPPPGPSLPPAPREYRPPQRPITFQRLQLRHNQQSVRFVQLKPIKSPWLLPPSPTAVARRSIRREININAIIGVESVKLGKLSIGSGISFRCPVSSDWRIGNPNPVTSPLTDGSYSLTNGPQSMPV